MVPAESLEQPDPLLAELGLALGKLNIHAEFNYLRQLGLCRRGDVFFYLNRDWKGGYGGFLALRDRELACRVRSLSPDFERLAAPARNRPSGGAPGWWGMLAAIILAFLPGAPAEAQGGRAHSARNRPSGGALRWWALLACILAALILAFLPGVPAEAQDGEAHSARYHVPVFNPGDNPSQQSWLRLVNAAEREVSVVIDGLDDRGEPPPEGAVALSLAPGAARTVTARDLESGAPGLAGRFGDGAGKWQLLVSSSAPIQVLNLLRSRSGAISNLSSRPSLARTHVPLFLAADGGSQTSFVRIINRSARAGTVLIHAIDDNGARHGPLSLALAAGESAHFNSGDLERGNPDKGLTTGAGDGHGHWRLELETELDILPLAYVRGEEGAIGTLHDVAARSLSRDPRGPSRPNILFISLDDMNTWITPFNDLKSGKPVIFAPHLARLGNAGIKFTNAHTPVPLCKPTRASIMAGVYPRSNFHAISQYRNEEFVGIATLTQHFSRHGYVTLGGGKIYPPLATPLAHWDVYEAFDRPPDQKRVPDRVLSTLDPLHPNDPFDWGVVDYDHAQMSDVEIADWAVQALQAEYDRPFFLGVGFHFPHLPWYLPEAYLNRYPLESIELPQVRDDDLDDIPPEGRHLAWVNTFHGTSDYAHSDHAKVIRAGEWKRAVRAYSAASTFVDEQIGRVLEALQSSPYADNTVVVVFADNGMHLGEKQHWRKKTLWEEGTRIPLILYYPALFPFGGVVESAVSLVDLYPTLLDLSGLPAPAHPLDGDSLLRAIESPDASEEDFAMSTWGRGNASLRDRRWRYIRYAQGGRELYDHVHDPGEHVNLLRLPDAARHAERVERYDRLLDRYHPRAP